MGGDPTDHTTVDHVHHALATEIGRRAERLARSDDGSDAALADIMEMLHLVGIIGRRTLVVNFPAGNSVDESEGRLNWMRTISFLEETSIFPGMPDLSLVLSELVRGQQLPSIAPIGKPDKRRTDHVKLLSKKYAVEAANRIERLCEKFEQKVALLKECGSNPRTIADWQSLCEEAGPRFQIEKSAFDHLTLEEAKTILAAQVRIIRRK